MKERAILRTGLMVAALLVLLSILGTGALAETPQPDTAPESTVDRDTSTTEPDTAAPEGDTPAPTATGVL